MNSKTTPERLSRGAAVHIRQPTPTQVLENTGSQRQQYDLIEAVRTTGFASVTVVDDDLGRSGSGSVERPGFEKLAAAVCTGTVGAVFCIEASRKGHDGLVALVEHELGLDPYSGIVFVFRPKRVDRIKVLWWDGTGLVLASKRLEQGRFAWPAVRDGVIRLSRAQFEALFEGLDWVRCSN